MKDFKNIKGSGIAVIHVEILKFVGKEVTYKLFKLVSSIYKTEKILKDFKKSVTVTNTK